MIPFALVCSCAQPIEIRGMDHGAYSSLPPLVAYLSV